MDSEENIMDIKIKQELHEEITCEDNEDAMMDASVLNGSVKLENKVKKELCEEFGNESDDNTEYFCEQCKTYFPYLSSLQLHMQNNDNCDEKIDVKSQNNSVNFYAMQNTEVKEASEEGNYTEKIEIEQEEKCNDKKTKRKRQCTEENVDKIGSEKDEHENDKRELVNLIMKDPTILRRKHHDGIFDKASFENVKEEETEGMNENDNDELVNLVMKDHIILRTNNHAEKIIAMKTEASEETSRDSMSGKSNVHDETSDGNNKMNNELCETRHDTIMNVIGDTYGDSSKGNASKCSNNTKITKEPASKALGTQNIPPESSHMPNQFEASKQLKTHVSNSRKRGASCDVCKKTFTRRDHLTQHVKRFHLKTNETENIPSPNQKHVCTLCDKSYESRKKLKSYFYNTHKTVSCDKCSRKFSRKDRLAEHMRRVHFTETASNHKFFCNVCDRSFETGIRLQNHQKTHRSRPSCDICSKTFNRKYALAEHVKRFHMGLKREHECKYCEKRYFDKNGLNRHTRNSCTKKKAITCKLCTVKYASQKKFEMHMADHPRFICDYCDKMYYVKNHLQKHITRNHQKVNVTEIVCKLCRHKFKRQKTLELHMADHPRFICAYCDKMYYVRYHLQMHIYSKHMKLKVTKLSKVKRNERKLCKVCRKKLSRKTFEIHMADHPTFICDYCNKVFYVKSLVLRHIKRIHLRVRHRCKKCGNKYAYMYLKRHMKCCKGNIE